jgi:glycine dehydrogenase
MITELTGLDISNASLLDEATAAAEAMTMAFSTHNMKRKMFYVSKSMFPQITDVINTRAGLNEITLVVGDIEDFPWSRADEFCGLICQTPDNLGNVKDFT